MGDLEPEITNSKKKLRRWWFIYVTILVLSVLWFVWLYWPS